MLYEEYTREGNVPLLREESKMFLCLYYNGLDLDNIIYRKRYNNMLLYYNKLQSSVFFQVLIVTSVIVLLFFIFFFNREYPAA